MQQSQGRYPLFKGATRVPTKMGVPRNVLLITFILCATLFMTIHLYAVGLFVFLVFIEWCVTKHDDRAFRILWLACKTKIMNWVESPFRKMWGGSTYSPRDYGGDE